MELALSQSISPPRDTFEELVRAHHKQVTRLAFRLLGWRDSEVEDVVHDVFLAAFERLDRFRNEASPWTWLAAITINRCRTHRRRKLLRLRWLRSARRDADSDPGFSGKDESVRRVRDAVARLQSRDREAIVLHHLEQMSIAQISDLTGDRKNAIEVRLHRARKKLRVMLGDEGFE
jgi:RNA polymerase sigma factor (sigma-70 family)